MLTTTEPRLALFPSTRTRNSLPDQQRASLYKTIAAAVLRALSTPTQNDDDGSRIAFVVSFGRESAVQTLLSLTSNDQRVDIDPALCERALRLAETLVASLPLDVLLDLAIAFAASHTTAIRSLFTSALNASSSLPASFSSQVVPAFTTLLSDGFSDLHAIRKAAHCICALLHVLPPQLVRPFACNKQFILILARTYDDGLTHAAQSYGGIDVLVRVADAGTRDAEDWERIYMEAKVDILDSFHVLVGAMLRDAQPDADAERSMDILLSLLEISSSSSTPRAHFINLSLLADYEHAYKLSNAVNNSQDARFDVLESALPPLDMTPAQMEPAGLKLLLRNSPRIPPVHAVPAQPSASDKDKDKGKAPLAPDAADLDLDFQVTQVLDILPTHSSEYVRALLTHPDYPFRGDPEKVIAALLEGTAPPFETITVDEEEFEYTKDRKNIWDDEIMDPNRLRFGKQRQDESNVLRDRDFINQMKQDILRRVEEMSDDEDVPVVSQPVGSTEEAFLDDSDGDTAIKVGDGEGSESDEEEEARQTPETILELAYISDPKAFDRDAKTRRGQARADLKRRTGWADEQIEGWRIMLERNPKKERILQKHEFSGNRPLQTEEAENSVLEGSARGSEHGRGRGRGGRGGRGSRGRGAATGGAGGSPSERAWKEKNKASRGNHNRKRGHDRKLARAGIIPGPSG